MSKAFDRVFAFLDGSVDELDGDDKAALDAIMRAAEDPKLYDDVDDIAPEAPRDKP